MHWISVIIIFFDGAIFLIPISPNKAYNEQLSASYPTLFAHFRLIPLKTSPCQGLTLNLDFNDIFHEVRYDGEYTLGLTGIVYANTMNTNYIRLSLTYNFGKLKQLNYKNKNVGESETQRAQ